MRSTGLSDPRRREHPIHTVLVSGCVQSKMRLSCTAYYIPVHEQHGLPCWQVSIQDCTCAAEEHPSRPQSYVFHLPWRVVIDCVPRDSRLDRAHGGRHCGIARRALLRFRKPKDRRSWAAMVYLTVLVFHREGLGQALRRLLRSLARDPAPSQHSRASGHVGWHVRFPLP
jgi:hypothetical protein